MTDLLHVLPDIDLKHFSHILPSLERALITTNDLLTINALDLAKRAQVPLAEVKRLTDEALRQLHAQLGLEEHGQKDIAEQEGQHRSLTHALRPWSLVSTLDEALDVALEGGFPTGYLSEVTGESAAGKTQLLLSLLLAVQLPSPHGLEKSALYITTEGPLQTTRLSQILSSNPLISSLPASQRPSLSAIHSTKVADLEAQDHVLRYQVPVFIERNNIGLIVLDSVAANFRAEFDRGASSNRAEAFAKRSNQLINLGALLRNIARVHNVTVVVANQVLDRFTAAASAFDYTSQPASQALSLHNGGGRVGVEVADTLAFSTPDPLALDHQQRFFTGWGDISSSFAYATNNLKTPSLGLTWTNQLAARVVLLKEPIYKAQDYLLGPGADIVGWTRHFRVAFAKWCADDNGMLGTEFEIWEGGIRRKNNDTTVNINDEDEGD